MSKIVIYLLVALGQPAPNTSVVTSDGLEWHYVSERHPGAMVAQLFNDPIFVSKETCEEAGKALKLNKDMTAACFPVEGIAVERKP